MSKGYSIRKTLKNRLHKKSEQDNQLKINRRLVKINKTIKALKGQLQLEFDKNKHLTRILDPSITQKRKEISVFDSVLTRTLNMKWNDRNENVVNKEIIVVQTFFFEILKSIISNGFFFEGNKYICFTASAGQIRTKKTMFIQEAIFKKHQSSLLCGLSPDRINRSGGVNINKYLAYLALCNSATDAWTFDLKKTIVVDDMELTMNCEVDFINDETFEIKRCFKDIEINFTDGCGMMLPSVSKKNFMIRMPWVKGLLVSFPFDKFIKEHAVESVIKDIYGQERDIIKENIEIIFTKSQFKMWKYYTNWEQYIELFYRNKCKIGICNEEEEVLERKQINYQMLQTLSDLSDSEISVLTSKTNAKIERISTEKNTMLKMFGVKRGREDMNHFQKSLLLYPELLEDSYSKHSLQQIKKKMVKEGRAGKLDIDCTYCFVCPDLYAFCEYLFMKSTEPKGLLGNGEVSFSDYEDNVDLDCLRSPHLYREHAVRTNMVNKQTKKWFTTKGIYTSVHDPISKILMFDNDGDTLLVVKEKVVVEAARRNMANIVPLYYVMKKADNHMIDLQMIYSSLSAAYTGGNIGVISNDITKVWNSEEINIDVIKWMCMLNNFTIDYAKTLYKPKVPKACIKSISNYTKHKVPHFFIYAKDKEKNQVEPRTNSTMNRISNAIINKRMNFNYINKNRFNYMMLMNNQSLLHANTNMSEYYSTLDRENARKGVHSIRKGYSGDHVFEYIEIRNKIMDRFGDKYSEHEIVDSLIIYLFAERNSKFKTTFWRSFGDIVYSNLEANIKKLCLEHTISCECCGIRVEKKSNRTKYCELCGKEQQRKLWKEHKRKKRNVQV